MQVGISGAPVSRRAAALAGEAGRGWARRPRGRARINIAVSIVSAAQAASGPQTKSNTAWPGLAQGRSEFTVCWEGGEARYRFTGARKRWGQEGAVRKERWP